MNKITSGRFLSITIIAILILSCFVSLATPGTTVSAEITEQPKVAVALGLVPSEFSLLDAGVRGYFTEKYPFLLNWTDFPIYYERVRESEDQPGTKVFRAEGRFELPSPTATFRLCDGKVELISEVIEMQAIEVQPLQAAEHYDVEIDGDANPEFTIHWRYSDFPNDDRADEVVAMVETAARTSWNTICGNGAGQWDFDEPQDDDGTVDIYINDNIHPWGPPGIERTSTLWTSNGTDDFIFIDHIRQQRWKDDEKVEWPTEQDCFTAGISHEFFHGVENAYSVLTTGSWIVEGAARFLPSAVNPSADFYTPQSSSKRSLYIRDAVNYLEAPEETLGDKSYDACIYWRYLYEHHGGIATIKSIFERIEAANPVTFADERACIDAELGTTDIAFADFASANYLEFSDNPSARDDDYYQHSGCYYADVSFAWNNWYDPLIPIGGDPYVIDDPSPVNPWAAEYIRVYFASFGFKLRSVFDGDSNSGFTVHAMHNDDLDSFILSPDGTWSGTLYTAISGLVDHVDFIVIRTDSGGDGDYQFSVVEVQDVEFSIGIGLQWLCAPGRQASDGSWLGDPAVTSFAVLSMLNWGYDESDEIVSKGINYVLSKINPDGSVHNQPGRYTYYTSIAILPLAATGNADYHDEIQKMRDWLIGSQWDESSFYGSVDTGHWYYGGFGYGSSTRPDLSNTQWALVGLKAADRVLGLEATDTYTKAADYFLERCQNADGGSGYTPGSGSIHTMTAASAWSYALCGRGTSDEALAGIQWLTDHYSLTNNDGWGWWSEYYYKVTLAKALTMTHKVKLGEHDWFKELAQKLTDEQYAEGNWPDTGMMGSEMSTCWAIMALQTRTLPPSGEFGMWATLESHCDLHMYDSLGRHTGINYITDTVEENIPGSDFKILDPDGNEVPYSGSTPDDGYRQVIELSGLMAGSYRIELVGTSDGPYHLTVVGLSDGTEATTHTFEGTVEEGDRLATSVTATSMEGALTLLYEPLISLPVLGVDPTHLDVVGQPGTTAQAAFAVRETGGEQTLHDVTMYCTDIVGVEGLVDGDDVTFDVNDFDIAPGGSQAVSASIPVPIDFKAPGVGSIVVESIDGGTRAITLTLLADITGPDIGVSFPTANLALHGRATLVATASDISGIAAVYFYVREPDCPEGEVISPEFEDLPATLNSSTGRWEYDFDTLSLPDGNYIALAKGVDTYDNEGWSACVPFSIRNWTTATPVPAVSQWGVVAMIAVFAGLLLWMVRSRRFAS